MLKLPSGDLEIVMSRLYRLKYSYDDWVYLGKYANMEYRKDDLHPIDRYVFNCSDEQLELIRLGRKLSDW